MQLSLAYLEGGRPVRASPTDATNRANYEVQCDYERTLHKYGQVRMRLHPGTDGIDYTWSNAVGGRVPIFHANMQRQNDIAGAIEGKRAQLVLLLTDTPENRVRVENDALRIRRKEDVIVALEGNIRNTRRAAVNPRGVMAMETDLIILKRELDALVANQRQIAILPVPRQQLLSEIDQLESEMAVLKRQQELVFAETGAVVDTAGKYIEPTALLAKLEQTLRNHPHVRAFAPPNATPVQLEVYLDETLRITLAGFEQSDLRVKPAVRGAGGWTPTALDQWSGSYEPMRRVGDVFATTRYM